MLRRHKCLSSTCRKGVIISRREKWRCSLERGVWLGSGGDLWEGDSQGNSLGADHRTWRETKSRCLRFVSHGVASSTFPGSSSSKCLSSSAIAQLSGMFTSSKSCWITPARISKIIIMKYFKDLEKCKEHHVLTTGQILTFCLFASSSFF